jgi:hypothetical protein
MRSIVIVALQLSLIVAIMLPFDAGGWSVPATALVGAGIAWSRRPSAQTLPPAS